MEIIFYYHFLGLGGVEVTIINRINALRSVGIKGEFWFSKFYGDGAKYIKSKSFIRQVDLRDPAFFDELQSYDAITVIDFPALIKHLESNNCSIPVVYETHASFTPALQEYYAVMESDIVSAIVVPSKFNRDLILETRKPKIKPIVIQNCIDTKLFSCDAPALMLPEVDIESGPIIIWVGRLEDEKNPQELISIARQVGTVRRDLQFLVIGDTPYYEDYLKTLEQSPESEPPKSIIFVRKVKFEGMPGIYNLAAKSGGLLLSTSLYESVPMTFIEAMACGCPILSTAVGGVEEILSNGKYGFLYKSGDIETATRLILELTDNSAFKKRNSVIQPALKYVRHHHSMSTIASQYASLLGNVVNINGTGTLGELDRACDPTGTKD